MEYASINRTVQTKLFNNVNVRWILKLEIYTKTSSSRDAKGRSSWNIIVHNFRVPLIIEHEILWGTDR